MTFTACIQRYRIIDLIIRAVRHFFIATVYGRTRRINQMLHRSMALTIRMAAGFQNVIHVCCRIKIPFATLYCGKSYQSYWY